MILRYFKDPSGADKWSKLERLGSKGDLFGMMRTYGACGYFFTVSPSMKDKKFAIRMMQRQLNEQFEEDTIKNLDDRTRENLTAENPCEAARCYDLMIRAFYTELVGCSVSKRHFGTNRSLAIKRQYSQKGAFGNIHAVYGVTEAQSRGGLHNIRAEFAPPPERVVLVGHRDPCYSDDPVCRKRVCQRGVYDTFRASPRASGVFLHGCSTLMGSGSYFISGGLLGDLHMGRT